MAIDVETLQTEALTKHGIRLDPQDPAVVLVTLNRLVLEDAARTVASDIRTAAKEFEQAAGRVQSQLGTAIATSLKAGGPSNLPNAEWSPRAWLSVGLFSGMALFLLGVAVGKWVLR